MNRGDLVIALQGEHGKPRPALVLQSDLAANLTSTRTVALLTSTELAIPLIRIPIEPSEQNRLRTRSFVMIDQIFSASPRRFGDVFGHLDKHGHHRRQPSPRALPRHRELMPYAPGARPNPKLALGEPGLLEAFAAHRLVALLVELAHAVERHVEPPGEDLAELGLARPGRTVEEDVHPSRTALASAPLITLST